jgi:hypothetical protein
MEQQFNIRTSLDKTGLIHNLPIEFFINNRRPIKFKCPTIKDSLTELDFKSFVGLLSLNPEQIKENNINLLVKPDNYGNLAIGLLFDENYSKYIVGYFLKYIDKSEYKDKTLYINDVKVISQELNYIVETIMISVGRKEYKEDLNEDKKIEEENPIMAKILAAQKEAEEKLNKIKQKKAKNSGKGYTIEEIMLAVSYELGLSMDYLLNLNYYALIWYFGFAAKVDAHKLNQMILSSGMSKQKSYSYWLNK